MNLDEAIMGPPETFSLLERAIWHVLEDEGWPADVQEMCLGTLEECEVHLWNN
jgi:hypothetical protein